MAKPQTLAQYLYYVRILSIFKLNPNFSFRLEQIPLKITFLDIQHNSLECEFATQWLDNDSNITANISATVVNDRHSTPDSAVP